MPELSADAIYVLCVLGGAFILFATELLPMDVVAVLSVLALVFPGVLEIDEGLRGFGHPAVIGVGALFLVSEGLLRTGVLALIAAQLERWSRGRLDLLFVLILVTVALLSGFLNNTPVVAMFIPVVLGLANRMHFNPSVLLIPLSFAAILGGTCTLIGTSTNIIVYSAVNEFFSTLPEAQRPDLGWGIFTFTPMGVIFAGVGILYMVFFSRRLLPERQTISSLATSPDGARLREYVTEIGIRAGGSLVGKRFGDTPLARTGGIRMLQLIRDEDILWPPLDDVTLAENDALIVAGNVQDLLGLLREEGLESLEEILSSEEEVRVATHESQLAEVLVQPNSPYVDSTLEDARFRAQFGVQVLAIQRHGMHLRKKLSRHPLRVGDLLLVQGTPADLQRIGTQEGLVLMSGVEDMLVRPHKAPIAIGILVLVVLMLSLTDFHMAAIALSGAMAMILTGCLPMARVYDSIHWRVLVLLGGTLALGKAMQNTGAAEYLAHQLVALFEFAGPRGLVVVLLVLAGLLTEMVSNVAVATIMVPIALKVAASLEGAGVDSPMPFIMAVAYGASCSFLTPIGYQTNTLVYGAGGYRFTDFVRLGAPLTLSVWILGGLLIPVFWPLSP